MPEEEDDDEEEVSADSSIRWAFLTGLVALSIGAGCYSPPLGFIVFGSVLLIVSFIAAICEGSK